MLRGLLTGLSLLTLIPVPSPGNLTDGDLARSASFFPMVGAILGIILLAVDQAARFLLTDLAASAIVLAGSTLLTGGLHLDGFGDTIDGLASRQGPEKSLEIMRDSRIGGLGAVGLILLLVLKFSFIAGTEGHIRSLAVGLAPVVGRQAMVPAMYLYPYARSSNGLGRAFASGVGPGELWGSLVITAVMVGTAGISSLTGGGIPLLAPYSALGIALLVSYLFSRSVYRRIGGMTGDTYGALNEVAEVVFLGAMLGLGRTL